MAKLDVKQVSTAQWLGIGAGVLAFVNTFLPWFSASAAGAIGAAMSGSANAWEEPASFLAWFTMLLLVLAGAIAALPLFGVQIPQQPLVWLGLAGLSFVLVVVKWIDLPGISDIFEEQGITPTDAQLEQAENAVDMGAGFGLYLGLILALVSLAGAVLAFQASRASKASPPPAAPPAA